MMRRVGRGGPFRGIPFPRKGRIRFVLVLFMGAFLIRLGPPFLGRLEMPSTVSAETAAGGRPDSLEQKKRRGKTALDLSDVSRLVSENPECLCRSRVSLPYRKDSLHVHTSIDTGLQRYLEKLMAQYRPLYGAIAAIEPASGRIMSLVSYINDSMPDPGGNLCLRSLFPAASVYKTITAAAAIELCDYSSDCIVEHRGRTSTLYLSQIKQVLDDAAYMSFAQAYAYSNNSVFARIGMYQVGHKNLVKYSSAFGFNTRMPGELACDLSYIAPADSDYALAELASGFNQQTRISPLHGALVAACITQDGNMPAPSLVDSIVRCSDTSVQYRRETAAWLRPITRETSGELRSMMQTVVTKGTATKFFRHIRNSRRFDDLIYGGKTGSVDKDGTGRVDWFIGFATNPQNENEQIAVGVVTVHGPFWTVHSGYLAAEAMRIRVRSLQEKRRYELAQASVSETSGTSIADSAASVPALDAQQ